MDELYKEGKFNKLGLSNYTAWEVAEVVTLCRERGWVLPSVYQAMYNVITRAIEKELVVACRRYGLDIVVYNPIAGGLFSGKIKSIDEMPKEGRFSDASSTGKNYRARYFSHAQFEALSVLEEAGQKAGLEVIEIALRWLVHHSKLKVMDGNDGVIIGVSSEEQLKQNLDLLEKGPLPEEVVRKCDEAWRKVGIDQPK